MRVLFRRLRCVQSPQSLSSLYQWSPSAPAEIQPAIFSSLLCGFSSTSNSRVLPEGYSGEEFRRVQKVVEGHEALQGFSRRQPQLPLGAQSPLSVFARSFASRSFFEARIARESPPKSLSRRSFHSQSMADTSQPETDSQLVADSSGTDKKEVKAERRFRCYTKTGDKGYSSLYNGERRKKDDDVFHALGDVDELNSAIGLAAEYCRLEGLEDVCTQLATIQSRLLDVGSAVATPVTSSSAAKVKRVMFDGENVNVLERWLDAMDDQLPPLTLFILPSGGLAAAHLHVARSICRRAERSVVELNSVPPKSPTDSTDIPNGKDAQGADASGMPTSKDAQAGSEEAANVVSPAVVQYLNRLSDYLFTAARFAAKKAGRNETTYKKGVN